MQYRRLIIPGTCYFFTVVLQDRRSDLLIRKINELRQAFKQVIERYPFIIDGIVVLPDHFHLMMTPPPDDANYSQRLGFIKSCFSRQIGSWEPISIVGEFLGKDTDTGIWRYFKEHWRSWFPGLGSRWNYAKQSANLWAIKQKIQASFAQ